MWGDHAPGRRRSGLDTSSTPIPLKMSSCPPRETITRAASQWHGGERVGLEGWVAAQWHGGERVGLEGWVASQWHGGERVGVEGWRGDFREIVRGQGSSRP